MKINEFEKNGYITIDLNFGYEELIAKTFEECIKVHNIQPDQFARIVSPPPIDFSMEYLAAIVHRDYTTSIVEKETGLKLIPTYCYSRKYFQGSILDSHTDRDAGEISLTYCISGPEWEINMGDSTLITKIGNGVIYKGCEILHGRLKPSSGEVIQVFNHWVISDGKKSDCAYDDGRNKSFYKNDNLNDENISSTITKKVHDSGLHTDQENIPLLPICVPKIFTKEQCERIITYHSVWEEMDGKVGRTTGSVIDPNIRQCKTYFPTSIENYPNWVGQAISNTIISVNDKVYNFDLGKIGLEMTLLRYDLGGHYAIHNDIGVMGITQTRKIAFTLLLNDSYEGGNLEFVGFEEQKLKTKPEIGDMIIFPSFVPHLVKPVTSGVRWVLIGWILGDKHFV